MSRKSTHTKAKLSTTHHRFSLNELRMISYIATLVLVGYLAYSKIDSPATYAFLGLLIGSIFGRQSENGK